MKVKSYYLLGSALGAVASIGLAAPAMAQDADTDITADQQPLGTEPAPREIVVTGSYLRVGEPEDGALPVDVFGTEELETRGIDSPLEFIKNLPSVGTSLGDSNQYGAGNSQGVGSLNLRNLGRERTLVLFNGRRYMPEPGDGAVDTNLIPMFALDRIEVLKDGAASTYGSDAIAGVANFVTRRGFDGLVVDGNYTFIDGSDGDWQGSVLFGKNLGDANIMVGAGYQRRSELPTTERSFTQQPFSENPSGYSPVSNPGIYIPLFNGTPIAGPAQDGNQLDACENLGGIDEGAVCRYSYIPFVNLVEDQERYQIYGQLDVDLSDSTRFHSEAIYAHTESSSLGYSPSYPITSGPNGPGSLGQFVVPAYNPYFGDFVDQSFAPGSLPVAPNAALIYLFRPFALGGNPTDPRGAGLGGAENDGWRVVGGLEHDFSDSFSGQFYGTFLRSTRTAYSLDFISQRLQSALFGFGGEDCSGAQPGANGCQFFNPFINAAPGNPALGLDNPAYVPGNENDPDLLDWIRQPSGTTGVEEQLIADLVFNGYSNLFGMDFDYAFGGQYRHTDYRNKPINKFSDPARFPCVNEDDFSCLDSPDDNNFPTGPFTFLGQYPADSLNQSVWAVFAEARIEPFSGLELIGALRYEDYGNPVGSTLNPKLSARWEATDWLTLRGSVGDTFRGPLPINLTEGGPSGVAGIDVLGNNYKATDNTGNPDLDPETALTYNIGAVVEFGGFSASVDFWNYEFEGRFTDLPVQAIAAAVAPGGTDGNQLADCSSPFSQFVTFAGGVCNQGTTIGNDISRIRTLTVNGPEVTTRGLDLSVNYSRDMGSFGLSAGANATYILEYEFSDFVYEGLTFSQGYDAKGFANYNRAPGTVSPWRANGYLSASFGNASLTWNALYIDGVTDNRSPDDPFAGEVGSFFKNDLLGAYTFDISGGELRLSAAVENIFDEDPPLARLEYSYDPFIGTALGRTYRLAARTSF